MLATVMTWLDQGVALFRQYVENPVLQMRWTDVVDILIVGFVFYALVMFARDRRAATLWVGMAAVGVAYFASWILHMRAAYAVLNPFFKSFAVVIVIMFQREFRDLLDRVGTRVLGLRHLGSQPHSVAATTAMIGVLSDACCELSKEKCGALIVVERNSKLGDYIKTGVEVDGILSCELLGNLFFNRSPLHDGAVIIRNGRVCAAGCILPSSKSLDIPKELGTRHRAAVGISEQSDAVVLVVSEETGTISIANNGIIKRGYNSGTLKDDLFLLLAGNEEDSTRPPYRGRAEKKKKHR